MSRFSGWSHSLRKAFVKDMSIPISVVQDPYFEHQMLFLDRQYNTLEKAQLLDDALCQFENEEEFSKDLRKIRETVIDFVKNGDGYEDFSVKNPHPITQFQTTPKLPDKCIYKIPNLDFPMISIDLVSANFQVFKLLHPKLVNNKDTYREFISDFTDLEYFRQSKKLRQIIFGNLNPRKQQHIQKGIMLAINAHIMTITDGLDCAMLSADEIVYTGVKDVDEIEKMVQQVKVSTTKLDIRVEDFTIEAVKMKTSYCFIKRFDGGDFQLKCCPGPYTVEVLRRIYEQDPHPYDKVFYNDGRICEYKDDLF